jgi:hypothetical protein
MITGKGSDARRRGANEGNTADDVLPVNQGHNKLLDNQIPRCYRLCVPTDLSPSRLNSQLLGFTFRGTNGFENAVPSPNKTLAVLLGHTACAT